MSEKAPWGAIMKKEVPCLHWLRVTSSPSSIYLMLHNSIHVPSSKKLSLNIHFFLALLFDPVMTSTQLVHSTYLSSHPQLCFPRCSVRALRKGSCLSQFKP